jgi:hypothetical protein
MSPDTTRRGRGRLVLLLALEDMLLFVLIHVGFLEEPGVLSRMSRSLKTPCGYSGLLCLFLQVRLAEHTLAAAWVPLSQQQVQDSCMLCRLCMKSYA